MRWSSSKLQQLISSELVTSVGSAPRHARHERAHRRNAQRGGGDSRLHGGAAPCPARPQCGRCHLGLAARDHQDSSLGLLDKRRANHAHQQPSLHAGSCDDCHTQRLPRLPRSGDGPRTGGAHRRRAAHGLAAGCGGARTLARRRLHASARRPPVDLGLEICLPAVPERGARAFHRLLDGRAQHRPAHVGDCLRRSERCAAARLHMHCTRTCTAHAHAHAHGQHLCLCMRMHCTTRRACTAHVRHAPAHARRRPAQPWRRLLPRRRRRLRTLHRAPECALRRTRGRPPERGDARAERRSVHGHHARAGGCCGQPARPGHAGAPCRWWRGARAP